MQRTGEARLRTNPKAALFLFAYAAAFSFAYLQLDAGVVALILFGAVQLTMVTAGMLSGEPSPPLTWFGLARPHGTAVERRPVDGAGRHGLAFAGKLQMGANGLALAITSGALASVLVLGGIGLVLRSKGLLQAR